MLTSIQNERIKQYKKLHKRKYRTKENKFLIEGTHLVEEALRASYSIQEILFTEDTLLTSEMKQCNHTLVSDHVLHHLSQTEAPQGMIAIVEMNNHTRDDSSRILLLDRIQDPGNLGTLIRSALAFGFGKVVLGRGSVDVYNDKVLRATQGALFYVDIESAELTEVIRTLKNKNYAVWVTALEDAKSLYEMKQSEKLAVILGNEGSGVSEQLLQEATDKVTIPIQTAESLNVAVAGSIIMYETNRLSLRE